MVRSTQGLLETSKVRGPGGGRRYGERIAQSYGASWTVPSINLSYERLEEVSNIVTYSHWRLKGLIFHKLSISLYNRNESLSHQSSVGRKFPVFRPSIPSDFRTFTQPAFLLSFSLCSCLQIRWKGVRWLFKLFPCAGRFLILLARSYVVSQTANPTNPHIPHGPTVRLIPSFCTEDIWVGFADGDCRTIPVGNSVGKSLNGSAAYEGG